MGAEMNRRSFLAGLLATTVIPALPKTPPVGRGFFIASSAPAMGVDYEGLVWHEITEVVSIGSIGYEVTE